MSAESVRVEVDGLLGRLILHPFLVSAAAPLHLYASNLEDVGLSSIALPLALSVALAVLLVLAARTLVSSFEKAAVLATPVLLIFWTRGHVNQWLDVVLLGIIANGRIVRLVSAAVSFVALASIAATVARSRRLRTITSVFNVFALALLAYPAATLLAHWGGGLGARATAVDVPIPHVTSAQALPLALQPGRQLPDIYYIVLDAYGREDTLRRLYRFDNSGFVSALRTRGFFVADKAHSNYGYTEMSLAANLNYSYLENLLPSLPPGTIDRSFLTRTIDDNRLFKLLRSIGYEIVTFPSGREITELATPDRRLGPLMPFGEFASVLFGTTALPEILSGLTRNGNEIPYGRARARVEFALDKLDSAAWPTRPAFVFVHLLVPHPPFLFGPEGTAPPARRPYGLSDGVDLLVGKGVRPSEYVAGYRGQIQWLNPRILTAIDRILRKPNRPAAILIQGDHGPRLRSDHNYPDRSDFDELFGILSAYYWPSEDYRQLYSGVSAVNSFPLLLNAEFGASLPLLPDRAYFSRFDDFYRLFDVTPRLGESSNYRNRTPNDPDKAP